MPADRLRQGRQQRGDAAHPLGHGGAIEIDALTGIDAALAMQRQAVGVFRYGDVSEQARARPPRSIGNDGSGACTIVSQARQLSFGRTCWITLNADGTYSSTSVTSSPILRSTV